MRDKARDPRVLDLRSYFKSASSSHKVAALVMIVVVVVRLNQIKVLNV